MPEYLAPGVFIEETSYRSKSIEGVGTSTAGFVGPTRYGPVSGEPEMLTSLADFHRIYGGLDDLEFTDSGLSPNYLALGVRAFFEEGGKRLYVTRVFNAPDTKGFDIQSDIPQNHYGKLAIPPVGGGNSTLFMVARFPGTAGNLRVTFQLKAGRNVYQDATDEITRVDAGDVVYVDTAPGGAGGVSNGLYVVEWDTANKQYKLHDGTNSRALSALTGKVVYPLRVSVEVEHQLANGTDFDNPVTLGEYNLSLKDGLVTSFTRNPERRFDALTIPFAFEGLSSLGDNDFKRAIELTKRLVQNNLSTFDSSKLPSHQHTLSGGDDGNIPINTTYEGQDELEDYSKLPLQMKKNGLLAFEGVEDISIIAGPGYSAKSSNAFSIAAVLINHCEKMRYRIAVLDTPPQVLPSEALDLRNRRSTKYAAIYYPWIVVDDPRPGKGGNRLPLPPSGFVAGIYARNDVEHAVFKAPANEVVRLAIDFEVRLSRGQQELLNPNAVNCFRFFEGRGNLLWGARTMTDDPEWKYVSLRRYFAYLEYSIDRGTQWAVFENNGPRLWNNVRQTIEDFLFNEWRSGGLLGEKPEEAYFVRCDRSTMTQNDLDNGRLVCLIGVAPVKPAEFVIFRIGQWTASSSNV